MPGVDVVFTPVAESDLDDIWLNIAFHNLTAADRLIDHIRDRTNQLALFPESGRQRTEIAENARSLVEGGYLILYRVEVDRITIIRVVHGARDLTSLL